MVQMYWQWALHHSVKQLIKLLHLPVARNEFCLLLESTLFNKISHNTLNIHDWLFHSHRHLILGWNRFQHLFIPNISLHKSCHHYVQLGNLAAQNFRHDIQNFLAYINVTFIYAICVLMYAPLSLLYVPCSSSLSWFAWTLLQITFNTKCMTHSCAWLLL